MREAIFWLARTEIATVVRHSGWAWAALEIVHVLGLFYLTVKHAVLALWISILAAGRMEAFDKPLIPVL